MTKLNIKITSLVSCLMIMMKWQGIGQGRPLDETYSRQPGYQKHSDHAIHRPLKNTLFHKVNLLKFRFYF